MAITYVKDIPDFAEKVNEIAVPIDELSASKVTVNLPDYEADNVAEALIELKSSAVTVVLHDERSVFVSGVAQPGLIRVDLPESINTDHYFAIVNYRSKDNSAYVGGYKAFIYNKESTGFDISVIPTGSAAADTIKVEYLVLQF